MMTEAEFDAALSRSLRAAEPNASRVIAALSGALPPQRRSWWSWPAALLDVDFAPAWPRVAALAAVAALGFAIGLAGLDVPDGANATSAAASRADAGLSVVAFEPEPLTGVRP
jgi:hypothetical protein